MNEFLQLKEPKEVHNGNVCTVCPRNSVHGHEAYPIATAVRWMENLGGGGERPFATPICSPLARIHSFALFISLSSLVSPVNPGICAITASTTQKK